MISVCFQSKPFTMIVIWVYAPTTNAEEAEVDWFCEDLQDLLELTSKIRRCPSHHRGLESKVESQEIPGLTGRFGLGVQSEARERLTEFCQENTLVTANTILQQHKRRFYTRMSPDGQYWNQIDYILHSRMWRSSIQSATIRPVSDCGSAPYCKIQA